jgi:hypothetical protein
LRPPLEPTSCHEAHKGTLDHSGSGRLTYEFVVKDEVLARIMHAIIKDPETLVRYLPAKNIPLRVRLSADGMDVMFERYIERPQNFECTISKTSPQIYLPQREAI